MAGKNKKSLPISGIQKYMKSPCAVFALTFFILNIIIINSICVQFSGEDPTEKSTHQIVKRSPNNTSNADKSVNIFFKKRQKALLDSTNKKVMVLGYALGGSSYIGDVFNNDPDALYWFEPINAFYQAYYGTGNWPKAFDILVHKNLTIRTIPVTEHRHIGRFMQYLLSCDTDHMSPQALGHKGLQYQLTTKDFYDCITQHDARGLNCSKYLSTKCRGNFDNVIENDCNANIELAWRRKEVNVMFSEHIKCVRDLKSRQFPCVKQLKTLCRSAKIHSAMVTRMVMDTVPHVINAFPDLHVIHVVRDPRAIVFSRLERNGIWDGSCNDTLVEAEYLCKIMKNDIEKRDRFDSKYPGVFMTVKYEDHFADILNSTTHIYDFIGQDIHPVLSNWLNSHDLKRDKHAKLVQSPTIEKWRTYFPQHVKEALTVRCKTVLERLGYPLDV